MSEPKGKSGISIATNRLWELYGEKLFLPILGDDKDKVHFLLNAQESGTEVKKFKGTHESSMFIAIDDDEDASNGRLLLRGTFIYDSPEKKLISPGQYNIELPDDSELSDEDKEKWRKRAEDYQSALNKLLKNPAKEKSLQAYAMSVGRSFSRPMPLKYDEENRTELGKALADFVETRSGQGLSDIVVWTGSQIKDQHLKLNGKPLTLRYLDPGNFYTLVSHEGRTYAVFTWAVDIDDDPEKRILLRDIFPLDENLKFNKSEGFIRQWVPTPAAEQDEFFKTALEKLQALPWPDAETAEAHIEAIRPLLTDMPWMKEMLPKDRTALSKRKGARQSLEAMFYVAMDELTTRADASRGWLSGKEPVNLERETELLKQLFNKAGQRAEEVEKQDKAELEHPSKELKRPEDLLPGVSAFDILDDLKLDNEVLKRLCQDIKANPLMSALNEIGKDIPDRAGRLYRFAEEQLRRKGRREAALAVFALVGTEFKEEKPEIARQAAHQAELTKENGTFFEQLAFSAAEMWEETPLTLASWALGGFGGALGERVGIWLAPKIPLLRRIPGWRHILPAAASVFGESAVATTGSHAYYALYHDPEKVFSTSALKKSFAVNAVGSSVTRGVHYASARWVFTKPRSAGRLLTAEEWSTVPNTAGGRLLPDRVNRPWTNTFGGKYLVKPVLNHTTGIAALRATDAIGEAADWIPEDEHGSGNTVRRYIGMTFGPWAANRVTGRRLSKWVAGARERAELKRQEEVEALRSKAMPPRIPEVGAQNFVLYSSYGDELISLKDVHNINNILITKGNKTHFIFNPQTREGILEINAPEIEASQMALARDPNGIGWVVKNGDNQTSFINGRRLSPGEEVRLTPSQNGDSVKDMGIFEFGNFGFRLGLQGEYELHGHHPLRQANDYIWPPGFIQKPTPLKVPEAKPLPNPASEVPLPELSPKAHEPPGPKVQPQKAQPVPPPMPEAAPQRARPVPPLAPVEHPVENVAILEVSEVIDLDSPKLPPIPRRDPRAATSRGDSPLDGSQTISSVPREPPPLPVEVRTNPSAPSPALIEAMAQGGSNKKPVRATTLAGFPEVDMPVQYIKQIPADVPPFTLIGIPNGKSSLTWRYAASRTNISVLIGKNPKSTIEHQAVQQVDGNMVDDTHLEIRLFRHTIEGWGMYLMGRSGHDNIYVNARRIDSGESPRLYNGDKISIGDPKEVGSVQFIFRSEHPSSQHSTAGTPRQENPAPSEVPPPVARAQSNSNPPSSPPGPPDEASFAGLDDAFADSAPGLSPAQVPEQGAGGAVREARQRGDTVAGKPRREGAQILHDLRKHEAAEPVSLRPVSPDDGTSNRPRMPTQDLLHEIPLPGPTSGSRDDGKEAPQVRRTHPTTVELSQGVPPRNDSNGSQLGKVSTGSRNIDNFLDRVLEDFQKRNILSEDQALVLRARIDRCLSNPLPRHFTLES
ncbi:MAG TPA: hypothetical protein DF383_10065, partial [Deltaproteobacteria bacterium]|nr:hypothetical protein [Deltaproteobacteria bacterium]